MSRKLVSVSINLIMYLFFVAELICERITASLIWTTIDHHQVIFINRIFVRGIDPAASLITNTSNKEQIPKPVN